MSDDYDKQEMAEREHAANIGLIVLALAGHEVGDWDDCSINDAITTIVDRQEPAHVLLKALADMDRARAAGIVRQCYVPPPERDDVMC
jgi:hypothetical protein